jgi:hypothetical protein
VREKGRVRTAAKHIKMYFFLQTAASALVLELHGRTPGQGPLECKRLTSKMLGSREVGDILL